MDKECSIRSQAGDEHFTSHKHVKNQTIAKAHPIYVADYKIKVSNRWAMKVRKELSGYDDFLPQRSQSGRFDVRGKDIANVFDAAKFACTELFTQDGMHPHFIGYGNNAAALTQTAVLLPEYRAGNFELCNIPSGGFGPRPTMVGSVLPPTLNEKEDIQAYRALLTEAGITPDIIVDAPENEPYVFIRPLMVTSRSYRALDNIIKDWVEESASHRHAHDEEAKKAYIKRFYEKSYIVALKPTQMFGKETNEMQKTGWSEYGHQWDVEIPEAVAISLRKMRNIHFMPTFNPKTNCNLLPSNAIYEYFKQEGRPCITAKVLDALRLCAEHMESDTPKQKISFRRYALDRPTLSEQLKLGITGGNDGYASALHDYGMDFDLSEKAIGESASR